MSTNPLLLQKQLRENAAYLENFAKDLKSWGEEMKRKESGTKDGKEVMGNYNLNLILTYFTFRFLRKEK